MSTPDPIDQAFEDLCEAIKARHAEDIRADLLLTLTNWRDSLRADGDYDENYLDGIDDAINTLEQATA